MIKEFKEFIKQGNAVELAIAFVFGAAFSAIVTSLVEGIIMPLVSLITGGVDFSNWFYPLDGNTYNNVAELEAAGAAAIRYGNVINAIINFLIIAFVLFLVVKALNKLKREPEADPTTKICPSCATEIPVEAKRCPHCTSVLEETLI